MKYKFKKNDFVYMVFAGELIKGIITKRYKSNDGENLYHVDFRSLNAGLGITADFVHIEEYRLNKSYQILLNKMLDNLIDRLKLERSLKSILCKKEQDQLKQTRKSLKEPNNGKSNN